MRLPGLPKVPCDSEIETPLESSDTFLDSTDMARDSTDIARDSSDMPMWPKLDSLESDNGSDGFLEAHISTDVLPVLKTSLLNATRTGIGRS
jgi:hypothetical protein